MQRDFLPEHGGDKRRDNRPGDDDQPHGGAAQAASARNAATAIAKSRGAKIALSQTGR